MRTLVIYFSSTGNTEKVSKELASRLGADLAEITCGTYLRWYGPLAMAWDIFTRHLPKVDVLLPAGAHYDVVVVGGPVWAAHAAPPVLALARHPVLKAALIAYFVTCSGDSPKSPPEPAIDEMRQMVQRPSLASWIFRANDLAKDPLAAATERFAHAIEVAAADHSRAAKQPTS